MSTSILFRCPTCEREINIPLDELQQIPLCPTHQQPMTPVGNIGEVNAAVGEVMQGLSRLAAAALRNQPGAKHLDKQARGSDQG
jgi:hypothetical protein